MVQHSVTANEWTQISGPGVSGAVWLDEDSDGAGGSADMRVTHGESMPLDSDVTKSKRVYRPAGNTDVLQVSPANDTESTWARCKNPGDTAIITFSENVGVQTAKAHGFNAEVDGAVRVQTQDNYQSEIVSLKICQKLQDILLASNTTVDAMAITLQAGHGTVVGNTICIREEGRFYQAQVLAVATNVITLDSPIDYPFTIAAEVFRSSDSLNVNGSVTPQIFYISPPNGTKWDIYGFSLHISDDTAMDDAKFGGITALTNGIVVRRKNSHYKNIFNIKTNADFYFRCDEVQYTDKAPAGSYGINAKKYFIDRHGATIRLDGASGDQFQIIVQDNLTGLSSFRASAWGHVVR